jgi:signal transduction histidine kinase
MPQSAAENLLETFAAELAGAGTSGALRLQISETLQRWTAAGGVLFLARTEGARYVQPLDHGASAETVDGRGPLVRWLRVNNEILVFRDRPDVVAYLTPDERALVDRTASDATIPLVHDGTLVAFICLHHVADLDVVSKRRSLLEAYASRAAESWRHLTDVEALQARRDALGHSNRLGMAGQVAASVAHEVRNPLAAIRSLVQFAKDTPISPEERESILGDVLEEVDRIDQTVTGMLQLSQPAASRQQVVDVNDLVRSVFRFVRAYARRSSVGVTVEATDEPLHIHGDDRELRQVVTNLLLNACQACTEGGRIVAAVRRQAANDAWAEIEISDTGAGIGPEHLTRIFEPFFTTKPQGTGLGLPYCRDVVERHGGTIVVSSTLGEGTRVRVQLPLSEVDERHLGG